MTNKKPLSSCERGFFFLLLPLYFKDISCRSDLHHVSKLHLEAKDGVHSGAVHREDVFNSQVFHLADHLIDEFIRCAEEMHACHNGLDVFSGDLLLDISQDRHDALVAAA